MWEPLLAAALAAGPDAVISHMAAATIHRFWGVRVHRSFRLDPVDVEERSGVRHTTPAAR